jgi:hypothetical protein
MRASLCYDFPLRPTDEQNRYMVQLVLPCDLQPDEANRICAFINTLVVDWKRDERDQAA